MPADNIDLRLRNSRGEKKRLLLLFPICILFVISDMFCFETSYPLVLDRFDSVIEVESVQQPEQSLSLLKSPASGKIQNKILISIPNLRKRKSEYSNQYPFLSYRKHIKYCTFQIWSYCLSNTAKISPRYFMSYDINCKSFYTTC